MQPFLDAAYRPSAFQSFEQSRVPCRHVPAADKARPMLLDMGVQQGRSLATAFAPAIAYDSLHERAVAEKEAMFGIKS